MTNAVTIHTWVVMTSTAKAVEVGPGRKNIKKHNNPLDNIPIVCYNVGTKKEREDLKQ